MSSIAIPPREILIPQTPRIALPRFEFPRWMKHGRERAAHMLAPLGGGTLTPLGVSGAFDTTLIYDTFTDSNGMALSSHTIAPTNTPATSWTNVDGTSATIQSNALNIANSTGAKYFVSAGVSDCTITMGAAFGVADGNHYIEIMFRYSDASNYWMAYWGGDGSTSIYQVQGGGFTQRASGTKTADTNTHTLKMVLNGNTVTFTIDGGSTLSYGSATFNSTATKHGIRDYRQSGASNVYDNYKITP